MRGVNVSGIVLLTSNSTCSLLVTGKAFDFSFLFFDFSRLTLYPTILLLLLLSRFSRVRLCAMNGLLVPGGYFVDSFRFFHRLPCDLQRQFCVSLSNPCFFYSLLSIALVRTCSTMLKRSVGV